MGQWGEGQVQAAAASGTHHPDNFLEILDISKL